MNIHLFVIVGFLLLLLWFLDFILSENWVDFYFRSGLPVFRKSFEIDKKYINSKYESDALNRRFDECYHHIRFKPINDEEIYYREAWEFSRTRLFHGTIRIDKHKGKVTVRAFPNLNVGLLLVLFVFAFNSLENDYSLIMTYAIFFVLFVVFKLFRINGFYNSLKKQHAKKIV